MMKRRSFLALLGFGAGAAATATTETVAAVADAPLVVEVPKIPITVPDYPVRMPVTISLTKEQVELCEIIGMNPMQYARNLIALDKEGKLEATKVDMKLEAEMNQIAKNGDKND